MGKIIRTSERSEEKPLKEPEMAGRAKEDPASAAAAKERIGWVSPSYTHSQAVQLDPAVMADNRCIGFSPNVPEGEAYRLLRTKILQRAREKGGNTLMVTSALPGEGKTLTAINFAFTVAKEFKQTVLLVDCDLRQQNVYKMLGIPSDKGLVDYILDRSPVKDLIIWPGVEKMTLISGGQTLEGSSEILGSPRMKDLVAEMKTRYPDRFVIFDVPPVLSAADALAFAPLVDHVVMVVQAGKTPLPDVKKALEMLPQEKILGIVLNRHEATPKDYYYKAAEKKTQFARQIRPLYLKEGGRKSPGILQKIRIGNLLYWWKEKVRETRYRKILWVSILSIAILAAIAYYLPSHKFDLTPSGGGPSGVTSPDEKIASVQKKPTPDQPKSTSPLPPQKEGEEGSPTRSSAPSVSSDSSSSEKDSQAHSAIPPKETQTVKVKDGEKPGKAKSISKKPAPPKKIEPPPKKDFFAIKILAVRDSQKAQEFMDSQKKKGFDIHSRAITTKDQEVWQQIYLGHFGSQKEARRFLNEKKIRQSYPGSVIMKLTR
jgi:non-specific protein-tyrosine kinase